MVTAKSLIKGSMILVISNMFLKAINFLLLPLYTSYLTPADYGIVDIITTFTSLFTSMLSLCMDTGFFTFYYDKKTPSYQKKVFNTTFWIIAFTSIIPLIGILFSSKISRILLKENKPHIIVMALFIIFTGVLSQIPIAKIKIINKMKFFSIINILSSVIMLILNIVLITKFKLSYTGLIISVLIANCIQLLSYLAIVRKDISLKSYDRNLSKQILRYAIPLIPATISSWVIDLSDRYIINTYLSATEVGLYSIANKITILIIVFSSAFQTAYPSFVFSNAKDEDSKKKFGVVLDYYFIIFIILAAGVTIFSKEIIKLMSTEAYWSSYTMVRYLVFGQITYGIAFIVGAGMSIAKKSTYSMVASWISAITNIVLNFILVPRYGVEAAGVTTLTSYIIICILNYFFSQKFYRCDYNIRKISIIYISILVISFLSIDFTFLIKILIVIAVIGIVLGSYRKESKTVFNIVLNRLKGAR